MDNTKNNVQALSEALQAAANCEKALNRSEWLQRHRATIASILREAPSGSGIDNGTKLDEQRTGTQRIVFVVDWHRMNEHGSYCGWRTYRVTLRPTFSGVDVDVTGRDNGDGTKDYLAEVYLAWALSPYSDAQA